jgi:hypothetical protein
LTPGEAIPWLYPRSSRYDIRKTAADNRAVRKSQPRSLKRVVPELRFVFEANVDLGALVQTGLSNEAG